MKMFDRLKVHARLFVLAFLVLATAACRTPPPHSQIDTAQAIVTGSEIALKLACDDTSPFGRPQALTLTTPEPTLDGVVQAVRSYLCNDVFSALLSEARGVIRRLAVRDTPPPTAPPRSTTPPPPSTEVLDAAPPIAPNASAAPETP